MIVVLLTHAGDIRQAQALLRWINRLGKTYSQLLLVADRDTPFDEVMVCQKLALEGFLDCHVATNKEPTKGWPAGPYSLFQAAAEAVHKRFQLQFLLLEPDAIPLQAGWLDKIKEAHNKHVRGYMGHVYEGTQNFVGEKFMSGIGVYPSDTFTRLQWSPTPVHWDVHHRKEITDNAAHTNLIHHFFGQHDGGLIFVPDGACTQPNHRELSWLRPDCVLFHRDKSHSLIRLLGAKYFGDKTKAIKVVFPVHGGDVAQAVRHAHWLSKLSGQGDRWKHTAIVSFDRSTPIHEVTTLKNILSNAFERVEDFSYPRAPIPGWPMAANWMFQNTAHHMSKQDHPWLLLEADAVVLRANWLERLQLAYDTCGQPFFGPYVKHMHHLNGVMVYPPDAPKLLPSAMTCSGQAWDYVCAPEMKPQSADASQLIQHVWTIIGGQPSEVGGGEVPQNMTPDQARNWIRKDAVIFHRHKGTALIEHFLNGLQL